jgi:ABC-2 type transport system ATP-binding protein
MNNQVLQVKDLDKSFGKFKALHNIQLSVGKSEVYGLIGQNGAGKTTLLRLIGGLMKPSGGNITIRSNRKFVGYMPQSCRFDDYSHVANTIRFFAALKKACVEDSFALCEKLELDTRKKVKFLSPGQQKKLQIVIAMAGNPDFYILDEPTAGLDPKASFEIMEIIKSIRKEGKSILVSSHVLSDMDEICTHIAIIEQGRIIYNHPLEDGLKNIVQQHILGTRKEEGQ